MARQNTSKTSTRAPMPSSSRRMKQPVALQQDTWLSIPPSGHITAPMPRHLQEPLPMRPRMVILRVFRQDPVDVRQLVPGISPVLRERSAVIPASRGHRQPRQATRKDEGSRWASPAARLPSRARELEDATSIPARSKPAWTRRNRASRGARSRDLEYQLLPSSNAATRVRVSKAQPARIWTPCPVWHGRPKTEGSCLSRSVRGKTHKARTHHGADATPPPGSLTD